MKSFSVFIVFLTVAFWACKNDPPEHVFEAEGQITGADARACVCCGGWFLMTSDTTFLFDQLPAGSAIDLNNAVFPIPVKFDYEADTTACGIWLNKIILTEIEQQ